MAQSTHQILIIEDEPAFRNVLRVLLSVQGYRVIEAETVARGAIEARSHKPDLLLVDLGLPDGDGLSVIRQVRSWSPLPIIVLSARTLEEQKTMALDQGADDYITKPFSAPDLLARIRAGLRRGAHGAQQGPILRLGPIQVDLAARQAQGPNGSIHLTSLEYQVLECLARQTSMVVRQSQLLREVWGPARSEDARSLRVFIRSLRTKLESDPSRPRYLLTETGVGYRLRTSECSQPESDPTTAASEEPERLGRAG